MSVINRPCRAWAANAGSLSRIQRYPFCPHRSIRRCSCHRSGAVGPAFTGLFMEKMVGFVKLYFPVFLLGAVFGKLIELSGFSRSIVAAAINILGRRHAIPVIVLVCALLTYGGVSLFVVAFAVYPFAAELFRQSNIPKRLIPATVALGHSLLLWTLCPHATNSEHYSYQFSLAPTPGRAVAGAYWFTVYHCRRAYLSGAAAS